MAFVVPQKSGGYRYGHGYYDGWHPHHHNDDYYREEHRMAADSSIRTF